MKKKLATKITELGLSEKEAAVYIALLSGGEMTADDVSKESHLNRSTTYVQLKSLMSMGLVSTYKLGKKTFFAAESPRNLERILNKKIEKIEQQRTEIKSLVPDLIRLFGSATDRPTVRIFEGKEGLTSMRNEMLEEKPELMRMITSIGQLGKIFSPEELRIFTQKRKQLGIKDKIIYFLDESKESYQPYDHQQLKRVTQKQLPFGSDLYIYNDSVSFASTDSAIVGVSISNKDIAKTCTALFEGVWNSDN